MSMRARKLFRSERGMSLVFVGLGLAAFVAATMLAIDVGMLMTARSQAQNSADAGAHGGAVALAFDDYYDRSADGPAVTNALRQARANQVMAANVSVEVPDVEFVNDPSGEPNRVKVTVHRSAARGNSLGLIIAPIFGIDTADIHATATAEASPADVPARCFPFTIPDKWDERTTPPFNSETSTYDLFSNGGKGPRLANPDSYVPVKIDGVPQPGYTGYDPVRDRGSIVRLKASNETKVSPSIYNPITMPNPDPAVANARGAAAYRANIVQGPCGNFPWGSMMTVEPGNMVGPTKQGMEDLLASDPDAHWDDDCQCVAGSTNPDHPRIGAIPLYDPEFYETGKQGGRNADFRVANYLGVFIEGMNGNEVIARIIPIPGRRSGPGVPGGMYMRTVRIVE